MPLLAFTFDDPITLRELVLAYRKVKAELWWMRGLPYARMLAEYEANLIDRLKARLRT